MDYLFTENILFIIDQFWFKTLISPPIYGPGLVYGVLVYGVRDPLKKQSKRNRKVIYFTKSLYSTVLKWYGYEGAILWNKILNCSDESYPFGFGREESYIFSLKEKQLSQLSEVFSSEIQYHYGYVSE